MDRRHYRRTNGDGLVAVQDRTPAAVRHHRHLRVGISARPPRPGLSVPGASYRRGAGRNRRPMLLSKRKLKSNPNTAAPITAAGSHFTHFIFLLIDHIIVAVDMNPGLG